MSDYINRLKSFKLELDDAGNKVTDAKTHETELMMLWWLFVSHDI